MSTNERGPVVVITGASAGVGRATAQEYAKLGARIGLLARGKEGLEGARRDVEELGGEALAIPTDVADADQVEAAARQVEERFGPIDIWVNNAMTSVFKPVHEIAPDEYKRVTEVTYLGVVYGTMAALKRMRPRDRGSIVQVGSALAYRAIPLQSAYCGSKHGIQGFTESLRTELIHDNSKIKLTMVNLSAMNTPQFSWVRTTLPNKPQPVPPIYQPEVAARAIVWAAQQNRREIDVGAPTTIIKALNAVVPGLLDKYLARTGFKSQQTDEPIDPDRTDNLFSPVPGDHGARGAFDDRSHDHSIQFKFTQHQHAVLLTAIIAVASTLLALMNRGDS
ncbi:MAG: SDR family oxidoreductase [Thermomicrobiales bacterium]